MRSMNRVLLVGRLGHDPELQQSKNGHPYARLSVATHRYRKTGEDTNTELTDWHSVFVWGPQAERIAKFARKGALLLIDGALNYWQVTRETGQEYRNAVMADQVQILTYPRAHEPAHLDNSEVAADHNAVAHL